MFEQPQLSEFEYVRKEFYRIWFYAYKCSQHARALHKAGHEEDSRAAMTSFRALSKQADEAYRLMDSLRPTRPGIVDVAVEEDFRYVAADIFVAEA